MTKIVTIEGRAQKQAMRLISAVEGHRPSSPGFLLRQDPDDMSFHEPAGFMVYHPSEVMDSTHFWRRLRDSGSDARRNSARVRVG
jgi:hypothetical protein